MEYTFEPLTKKNQNDLKPLYKAVFGKTVSYKQIDEKYNTSYLGKSHFGYFAYFKGKPIAFFGTILMLMQQNGASEISAQCVDSMILPSHSGKGLFTKLGILTFENLKNNNITFIWGFANQNSENRVLKSLGFTFHERFEGFKIFVAEKSLENVFRKFALTRFLHEKYCSFIFSKYKSDIEFKGSLNEKNIVKSIQNKDFQKYKSNNSNFVIKINNIFFWIKIQGGLLVGDIQLNDESNFDEALNKLIKLAKMCCVKNIIFQTSPNTTISKLLKNRKIEKFESWAICYKNFSSEFPLENLKLTLSDIDTF